VLKYAQDRHDFPQGDPCGKRKLKELRCDTWGGFVWYSMSNDSPSLQEFLAPIPEIVRNYPMDTAVRVYWLKVDLNTNWKFSTDNFSESYHTRTAHPQVPPWIDQDVDTSRHEMYPNGSGRTGKSARCANRAWRCVASNRRKSAGVRALKARSASRRGPGAASAAARPTPGPGNAAALFVPGNAPGSGPLPLLSRFKCWM